MAKTSFVFLACLGLLLAMNDQAWAWGAGVHLVTGNFILDNLSLISPAIAELLRLRRNDFLYGCLSADIFIGKGTKVTPDHCHNWSTGLKLLDVDDPRLKAYAWGYLTHLAADVVAHNYYVPNMLHLSPGGGKLSHVWLEMQADAKVGCCWQQALTVFNLGRREQDRFLRATLDQTKLSFGIKKQLYRGGLSVCMLKPWRDSLSFLDRNLPLGPSSVAHDAYLTRMLDLSMAVTLDFLRDPEKSAARSFDPIGSQNLALVQKLKRGAGRIGRNGRGGLDARLRHLAVDAETGLLFPTDKDLIDLLASAA